MNACMIRATSTQVHLYTAYKRSERVHKVLNCGWNYVIHTPSFDYTCAVLLQYGLRCVHNVWKLWCKCVINIPMIDHICAVILQHGLGFVHHVLTFGCTYVINIQLCSMMMEGDKAGTRISLRRKSFQSNIIADM